jgi:hypothetical protein
MEYDPAGHNLSRRVPSFGTKGDSGPRDLGGTRLLFDGAAR